ncbi:beta strand repeat-containing protein [Geminisphaera colitermitum]|uniref:beta strand repeat-containing protein n=1 Tax=Geminisphaera colitermitum TaxID=1148786 RepID=UPI0001965508|nr:autotransporter-associated beta strand repeat-containing protein [Geminisphaera colitermitum]
MPAIFRAPPIAAPGLLILAGITATLALSPDSSAQTWTGAGANSNWSTPANWENSLAPANDGTANIRFDATTPASSATARLDAPWNINTLSFTGVGATPAIILTAATGSTITLQSTASGTSASILNNTTATQTIQAGLILGATTANSSHYINAQTGTLDITGNIALSNNRIVLTGAGNVNFSGVISGNGATTGAIVLDAGFTGTATLSGNSTFNRQVAVREGTLVVKSNAPNNAAGALGQSTRAIELGHTSGTRDSALLIGGAHEIGRVVQIKSTTGGGRVTLGGNTTDTSVFSGNITLGDATAAGRALHLTAAAGGTVILSGNLLTGTTTGATDSITKIGAGTVILTGTGNTYAGTTTVSEGTLLVNAATAAFATAGQSITVAADARLGGTGIINRDVNIQQNGILIAGTGGLGETLTINSDLTLATGSIIAFALGESGAHSTLTRQGGTWQFDANQSFLITDLGAQTGTYTGIVTGLTADTDVTGWTLRNAGWAGQFINNSGTIDLLLTQTSIPEPHATVLLLALGTIAAGLCTRARRTHK